MFIRYFIFIVMSNLFLVAGRGVSPRPFGYEPNMLILHSPAIHLTINILLFISYFVKPFPNLFMFRQLNFQY